MTNHRLMRLVIDDFSGVITFSEEAAERWRAMGKRVENVGDSPEQFEKTVREADKTVLEWVDSYDGGRAAREPGAHGSLVTRPTRVTRQHIDRVLADGGKAST